MKRALLLAVCTALIVQSAAAGTDGFAGNEALKRSANGDRIVELPPGTNDKALTQAPPSDTTRSAVYMIETKEGLVECSRKVYASALCRPSSIGRVKLMREWVVKLGGRWQQCGKAAKGVAATHGQYICNGEMTMSQYAVGRLNAKE